MNERIKELAAQAYMQERLAENPEWKPNRVYDCLMKDFEQVFEIFAGLVVEECLLAISKTKVSDDEIPTMVKCHTQVEKHFGV